MFSTASQQQSRTREKRINQDTLDLAATNIHPQPALIGPVTGQERFASMDVIRGVVLGIVVFQLIISRIWLKYFRFGPLEWVWRSLTYMKRPRLRR